jgi:DNA polymerase theta
MLTPSRAQGGSFNKLTENELEAARIHQRFYAAFQLRDLCNEIPIHAVARKYEIPRGAVQNLAQACHGFAAGIIKFCQRLGWGALAAALDHMSDRLKAGIVAH